jgi:hypothetical protein
VVVSVQVHTLVWLVVVIEGFVLENKVVQFLFMSTVSVPLPAVQYRRLQEVNVTDEFTKIVLATFVPVAHIVQAIARLYEPPPPQGIVTVSVQALSDAVTQAPTKSTLVTHQAVQAFVHSSLNCMSGCFKSRAVCVAVDTGLFKSVVLSTLFNASIVFIVLVL